MPSWLEQLLAGLQSVLPQRTLTRLVHWLMRRETPWVKDALIKGIGKAADINFAEAADPDPGAYRSFNEFFTRELKAGVRPLDPDPLALVSPCDGRISECGPIDEGRIYQAKGHDYSLQALLADDPACRDLRGGNFWTIYLSPRDYHRVHMPLAGTLRRMIYVPGKLYSVAPYTVRQIPGLFAVNERVVCIFDTEYGPFAQVLVGAMLVASMDTVWAGTITPAKVQALHRTSYEPGQVALERGAEMGRFNMGSTVVMALPPGVVGSNPQGLPGANDPVQLGRRLATLTPRKAAEDTETP
jgi:phosphatidylserine decarboxylase